MHLKILESGQIIIFHQARFSWNKDVSLTKPPFEVRSGEVAIIWPVESEVGFSISENLWRRRLFAKIDFKVKNTHNKSPKFGGEFSMS